MTRLAGACGTAANLAHMAARPELPTPLLSEARKRYAQNAWQAAAEALLRASVRSVRASWRLHSSAYKSRQQLRGGSVLIVGAGNCGAEIALELASGGRKVFLSGRDTGQAPFSYLELLGQVAI